jgi:hypothetical protein
MENGSIKGSEGSALDKLRRHVRILVDIGRLAAENTDFTRFLDQAVVQIARAVEIHHVLFAALSVNRLKRSRSMYSLMSSN